MNFYFVTDDNTCLKLNTSSNKETYEYLIKMAKEQPMNWGVVGAIDNNNRLRASLLYTTTDRRVFTKVHTFLRKYSAIGALEDKVQQLKADEQNT